ncbi:MAG: hypothetical protein AB7Q97_23060 [Gammaproteobacteria bacterium]
MRKHPGVNGQLPRRGAAVQVFYDKAQMEQRIASLDTAEACERFARNAGRLERPDLAIEARKRSIKLRVSTHGSMSPVEAGCLEAVYAHEEVLAQRNGRRVQAFGAWRMIKQYGILATAERLVNRKSDVSEYHALAEIGLHEFAIEAVVLRFPDVFTNDAVSRSRDRIAAWTHEGGR